jgi:hypothetical protein
MRPDPPTENSAPRRSRLADARGVAVVIALAVALIGALWFLFLRGDPQPTEETSAPAAPAPPPEVPAARDPEAEKNKEGRRSFQVFAPRDPFDPLVSASVGGAPDTGGTTVGGGGDVSGGSSGNGGGGGATVGGRRIEVIDVYRAGSGPRAQIEVDGTVYTVSEGESFGDGFKLVSTSGRCATMTRNGDRFTGCEGEEILK